MKRFLILIVFLIPLTGFSQLIVSDPLLEQMAIKQSIDQKAMAANTARHVAEAYKHTQELTKSAAFLKKQYERLNKINAVISNLNRLDRLVSRQKRLISETDKIVKDLETSDLYSLKELNTLHKSFTRMISTTNDVVDMLDIILKPKTKMSDAERLILLRQMEEDFRERQALMNKTLYEYRRIKNQRVVNKTLKAMHQK